MAAAEVKERLAELPAKNINRKRRLSRFWRFTLIYAAVIILLNIVSVFSEAFSDFYADHIFRIAAASTGRFSGMFPFSLGEILISLAVVLVFAACLISVMLIFLRKREKFRAFAFTYFKTILTISLTVVLLYTLNCSILYCSTMLNFADGTREFQLEDVETVRNFVVVRCNELSEKMERSDDGTLIYKGNADTDACAALRGISDKFPRLSGYYPPAKEMAGSFFMYKSGIIGVYFPFSMEANYSRYVSDSYLPHVIAHEYAHLKGYIYESEANFMSFLACINSDSDAVRYSGYLCVLNYINNDYTAAVSEERAAEQPAVSDLVRFDNNCYDRSTWEQLKKMDEKKQPIAAEIAENVSDKMTDAYLDAYSYEPNYSEVTLLMMQYYVENNGFDIASAEK